MASRSRTRAKTPQGAPALSTRALLAMEWMVKELEADLVQVHSVKAALAGGKVDHMVVIYGRGRRTLKLPAMWFMWSFHVRMVWWGQNRARLMA